MSERLIRTLSAARAREKSLLMCGLVAGDPYLEATREHMLAIVEGGADIIEVLLPFSDPVYHGPVVNRAFQRANIEGVTLQELAEECQAFREESDAPVIVSTYYNRLLAGGLADSLAILADGGVDGVLVADLPWAHSEAAREFCARVGLAYVPMLSPLERLDLVETIARELPEGVGVLTGHVGGELLDHGETLARSKYLKQDLSSFTILAAMQVSTPVEALAAARLTHGVVVTSSIVWMIEGRGQGLGERISSFVRELREGIDLVTDS